MRSKVIQLYKHIYPVSNSFQSIFVIRKWKSLVMSDSLWPHGLYSPWNSSGQNTGAGRLSLLQGIFCNPEIEPRSPALQMDPLPIEPPGKPKNTGVDSLSLLPWIFPNQESNRGLLHCRWFLHQLSYQGSPILLQGMSRILCAVTVGPCWFFILNIAVCTWYTFKEQKYRAKISV